MFQRSPSLVLTRVLPKISSAYSIPRIWRGLVLISTLGLFGLGCGVEDPIKTVDTTCPVGTAIIGVLDGALGPLCGCAEGPPTTTTVAWVPAGQTFTCTLARTPSTVLFQYMGKTNHQIIPQPGTVPTFQPSAPYLPRLSQRDAGTIPARTHAVDLSTSGTYLFEDNFETNLTGRVIAP